MGNYMMLKPPKPGKNLIVGSSIPQENSGWGIT
jgi:hypothetical protein